MSQPHRNDAERLAQAFRHPAILIRVTPARDLAADLAGEIRAAVAETSPRPPGGQTSRSSTGEEESARSALDRALSHLTPTIPQVARFSRIKRIAVRLFRFLWRDQAAFNALWLEAGGALVASAARERESVERLGEDLVRLQKRYESSRVELEQSRAIVEKKAVAWERRWALQDARLANLEAAGPPAAAPTPSRVASTIPPGVYSLFEERFRGTPEEIAAKQRDYVQLLEGAPGPALDVGCGRGEFLRLLSETGIPASGVEINPIAIAECRRSGLPVEEKDALAALEHRPPGSLGAVVALQVVEHWTAEMVFAFLRQARRVLAPGGILIVETINVDSLSAWKAFYLDPSHVRPVPAESLRFLAEAAGFVDTRIEYRAPLPPEDRLAETSGNAIKLNRLLFGPQDYALIARVPPAREA